MKQILIIESTNKSWYIQRIDLSNEKELTTAICRNRDEFLKHNVKQKSQTQRNVNFQDSILNKVQKQVKLTDTSGLLCVEDISRTGSEGGPRGAGGVFLFFIF